MIAAHSALAESPLDLVAATGVDRGIDVFAVAHVPSPSPRVEAIVCDSELLRAQAYVRLDDRVGFLMTRASLRTILGERLGIGPRAIEFEQDEKTGLRLASRQQRDRLSFSVSHAEGLSLIAVANRPLAIGVDLERRRAVPDALQIAEKLFGAAAADGLARLPVSEQPDAFFRLWTSGEALTKALGCGLAGWRSSIPIRIEAGKARLCDRFRAPAGSSWVLQQLPVAPQWIASLVFATSAGARRRTGDALARLSI